MKKLLLLLLLCIPSAHAMEKKTDSGSLLKKITGLCMMGLLASSGNSVEGCPDNFHRHDRAPRIVRELHDMNLLETYWGMEKQVKVELEAHFEWEGDSDCRKKVQGKAHQFLKNRFTSEQCRESCIGYVGGDDADKIKCSVCGTLHPSKGYKYDFYNQERGIKLLGSLSPCNNNDEMPEKD